jgi:hypothetical protein
MRRGWLLAVCTTLVSALVFPVASATAEGKETPPAAPDPCTQHVAYQVDAAGFFNAGVGTNDQCEPQAGSWDLMYRWPYGPGTSFTTVKSGSGTYVLGQDVAPVRSVDAAPGSPDTVSEREYLLPSGLRVTQRLEIGEGFTPNRLDMVKASYTIANPTGEAQPAELRVMLDTELNYNDGAPFQIPGVGPVTTEREFSGADVPDFYAAFANFQDPEHIGAGLLKVPGEIVPSRVVFGTWPNLSRNVWDVTTNPAASITADSAVAAYFRPPSTGGTIPAGESVTFTTRYGRASTSSDLRPPLSMTVLAPAQAALGSPFQVSVYVTNVGTGPATNGFARLYVPSGFTVAEPTAVALTDPLDTNRTQQVTWTVTPVEPFLVGTQPISVTTLADNAAEKIVTRDIEVVSGGRPVTTYPLLGAHGITGQAADMDVALQEAANTVPNLSGRQSVPTGAITSVWTNGQAIVDYTRGTLLPQSGATKANVIAHSKGGLDTRVAMWNHPELFDSLGMLATPNGGSGSADTLCFLRRLPFGLGDKPFAEMGPCDSEADGLFDLQTGYMKDVFNVIVRDHPEHLKVVAAGDCGGSGRVSCNGANALAKCKGGSDGIMHGDKVVCVESAFARTTAYGDGLAQALSPLFDADHTGMRTNACPITRVLAELYPLDSVGNQWLAGGSCGGRTALRTTASTSTTSSTSSTSTASGDDFFGSAASADQVPRTVLGSPTAPAAFTVDPEGGDRARATVVLPAGVTATVSVTDAAGAPDASATVTPVDLFGDTGYQVTLTGLAGQSRRVQVTPASDAQVGLLSTVLAGSTTATATVTPGAPGAATQLAVTVPGVSAAAAKAGTVSAAWQEGATRRTTTLTYDSGADLFRGSFVPPAGTFVPLDISVDVARRSRMLSTGVVVADGTGSFTGVGGTSLVDTTGDGKPDVFRVPVQVDVAAAGTYQVAADLATNGRAALSVGGSAQLQAGAGVVTLDVPVRELLLTGVDGPYDVTSAVLTEGTATRRIVARQATIGSTGPFATAQVPTTQVVLSRPAPSSVDGNRDGRYDTLRFAGAVSVPTPGDYLLSATLLSPTGLVVGTFDRTVTLPAGRPAYVVDFPGELVGANGSGRYSLAGLTLTAVDNPRNTDRVHQVQTGVLDSAQWVGGTPNITTLQQMWKAAQDTDAVSPFGLYVSESNRLERVARAIASGDAATARTLLGVFVTDVGKATGVDPDWSARLTGYASTLQATL